MAAAETALLSAAGTLRLVRSVDPLRSQRRVSHAGKLAAWIVVTFGVIIVPSGEDPTMTGSATRRSGRAEPFKRVTDVLGAQSLGIHSAIELHERIVEGLPRSAAVHLVASLREIKLDESMRALNISSRTWHRIKADKSELGKPLDVDQSARGWSMAEILAKAQEVLGTREQAEAWLSQPAIGLESRRPIDLMATPQGAELVKTLLERMEYGV